MSSRKFTGIFLPAFFMLPAAVVFAQTETGDSDAARSAQQKAQQEIAQQKELIDRSNAQLQRWINDIGRRPSFGPSREAELKAKFFEFRQAIPKFRIATDEFRWAMSLDNKLDKPLKNISSQADVMLKYLSLAKVKYPQPDPAEFKDYSQTELVWETLNSAERIASFLDLAVEVERQEFASPATMEFMYRLDGELRRLKWLTEHTKG